MSVDPIWTVWCDAEPRSPTCPYWCHETAARAPEARANARAAGWKERAGRNICPDCWEFGGR